MHTVLAIYLVSRYLKSVICWNTYPSTCKSASSLTPLDTTRNLFFLGWLLSPSIKLLLVSLQFLFPFHFGNCLLWQYHLRICQHGVQFQDFHTLSQREWHNYFSKALSNSTGEKQVLLKPVLTSKLSDNSSANFTLQYVSVLYSFISWINLVGMQNSCSTVHNFSLIMLRLLKIHKAWMYFSDIPTRISSTFPRVIWQWKLGMW